MKTLDYDTIFTWLKLHVYLILTESSPKSPDAGKGEIGLIYLTRGLRWNIFWYQKAVQQSAKCLNENEVLD